MVLFLLALPSMAIETAKIKLEINGVYKVSQKGLTKGLVVKSYVADIKIFPDYAEITAHNQGSSYIYLWSGNEVSVYNLDVSLAKPVKKVNRNFLADTSQNTSGGRYSVNMSTGFNLEKKLNFQQQNNLIHSLSYKLPFFDGNLNLASVFLTGTKNFNEVSDLSIENINLFYTNKNYSVQTGDLTAEWKNSNLLMKGFSVSYNNPGNTILKFTGGFLERFSTINLLNKSNSADNSTNGLTNNIAANLTGTFTPWKFLEFSPSLTYKQNDKNNLGLKLKLNPLENFNFNTDIQTDLTAITQSYNMSYNHDFMKNGVYVEGSFAYNSRQKGYTEEDKSNSENYAISGRIKHSSNLTLSSNYNVSSNSRNTTRNGKVRLSKSFFGNSLEFFGEEELNILNNQMENKLNFGSLFQATIPLPFKANLEFHKKISQVPSESFNFDNQLDLLNIDNLQVDLNNNFNYSQEHGNKIKQVINNSFTLNSAINWNSFLATSLSLGFNYNYDESGNNFSLSSKMNNIIKLSPYYDLNVQMNLNDNLTKNNHSFNTNINFNYKFGQNGELASRATISGTVFEDINGNGILDQEEKPVENIRILLKDKIGNSDKDGHFSFRDLDSGSYELSIDKGSLDKNTRVTTSSTETIELNGKNQEINFGINNRVLVKGFIYANKNKDKGIASVQINMDNIENTSSEEDGSFSFQVIPGLHIFKVDYSSLPKNYKLTGKPVQNVEIKSNGENIVEFVFNPVRTVNGIVHSPADTSKGISGINLKVKYFDGENFLKEETIKTDEDGEFSLTGLDEGIIEISSDKIKKSEKITIPNKPFIYEVKLPLK